MADRREIRSAQRVRRTRRGLVAASTTAIGALVVTLAVVWPGYDAQDPPPDDGTIWALQSGEGRRYARVNVALGELDTVKRVENPSGIVQSADRLLLYTDGDARVAGVDLASPPDLGGDAEDAFDPTPRGTIDVASAGGHVAYLTDTGAVYAAPIEAPGALVAIDPDADRAGGAADEDEEEADAPSFAASAVAVSPAGLVVAYSPEEGRVLRADAATGEIRGEDPVANGPGEGAVLRVHGERWSLTDPADGSVWLPGADGPVVSGTTAGLPAAAGPDAPALFVADAEGLVRISWDGAEVDRIVSGVSGTPAPPAVTADAVFAAWLPDAGSGTLWSSADGTSTLDYAGGTLGEEVVPEFLGNGARTILNETRSGWVWTLPDGALVPSSQEWEPEQEQTAVQREEVEAERVIDPKPPVAVDDAFGVRAGRTAVLPVLLNDSDPNEDVLSIAPDVEGPDPAFGTVAPSNQQQELVIDVPADATGTAELAYRADDGTAAEGLYSEPATARLRIVPDEENSAPVWCGVEGCLAPWPTPQVRAGGTVTVNVLRGWVDPEGDPLFVSRAEIADASAGGRGAVTIDPTGTLTYQHPDPNAAAALTVPITVTVSDARGASAERVLEVEVTPAPTLTAESFAASGSSSSPIVVDVLDHVSGADGGVRLVGARAIDDDAGSVTLNAAGGSFTLDGARAGSYLVQYTVADNRTEATGLVRISVLDAAEAQISSPPLTAFVRPGEDATIDLLSAVSNPTDLVLLASDPVTTPAPEAALGVDLVGQSLLRVSGSTDDAEPGTLGVVRYTVSDGTGNAATTATGDVTVILLPAAGAEPPIAVDDAVTVRAGSQIDIPVLENDTTPAGTLLAVDPASVSSDADEGLAFGSGPLVRYLAPETPGTYTLSYAAYRIAFPEASDTARVFVTVVPRETNLAPTPRDLTGRVLSGASVTIPFDRYGVDPDGDQVFLDRILTQPERGSARISAEGDAIVYTSAPGDRGQVSFTYRVRDARGATGEAGIRVGVLDGAVDPRPVTFSDYVAVQQGETNTVRVRPAENDLDPAGGELELLGVRPNAEVGTEEYARLDAQLRGIDGEDVTLGAGDALGTSSFVYTVRNGIGDTAMGLIVLKVVREPVPDYPSVRDTTLTVETREDFPDGIDVLAGRVSWGAGDVSDLELSLWGEPEGVAVDGWRLSGAVPDQSLLIPFEVRGTAFDGREVVSYGFLRVPGTRDIQLTLRAGFAAVSVDERGSVEVDLARAVARPPGSTLVVSDDVRVGGGRPEATCTLVSATTIRYDAGSGQPWNDLCTVPVRLEDQDADTYLAVRLSVVAADPQPELRPASITVSPGETATYALTDLTTWASSAEWSALEYAANYAGDQFVVAHAGSTLTITAKDVSRPGREEPVTITVPSHPSSAPATLTMRVGPAPSTLPKGATATAQCSQGGGSTSCEIPVIGQAGEVNPLPGTPLRLTGVEARGNCPDVAFDIASPTSVRASWPTDAAGSANCTSSFRVADAQGRVSAGDRNGTVILDLQGLPGDPARAEWTGYTDDSVTLRVVSDARSYPAVTGYRVTGGGRSVTCGADGACPAIPAPDLGAQATYDVRAVNAVGESRGSVSVRAWSYRPPNAPTGSSARPVPTADGSGRLADVTITGIDPSTAEIELRGPIETRTLAVGSGGGSVTFPAFPLDRNDVATLTATPITALTPPAQLGAVARGGEASVSAFAIGAPGLELRLQESTRGDSGSITATAVVRSAAPAQPGVALFVGFATGQATCTPDRAMSGVGGEATQTFDGLTLWEPTTVRACATYAYRDARGFGTATAEDSRIPTGTIPAAEGDPTYRLAVQREGDRTWRSVVEEPSLRPDRRLEARGFQIRYGTANAIGWGSSPVVAPLVNARQSPVAAACHPDYGCSAPTPVTLRGDSEAPRPFGVRIEPVRQCTAGTDPVPQDPRFSGDAVDGATDVRVEKSGNPSSGWSVRVTWLASGAYPFLADESYAYRVEADAPGCLPAEPPPDPTPAPPESAP